MNNKTSPSSLLLLRGKQRPRPAGFECGEILQGEQSIGSVAFYCTLPLHRSETSATDTNIHSFCRLTFGCRDRSVGVLENEESVLTNEELQVVQDVVDPNFFDAGYTLAGRTGFQVWAGTRLMLESLLWPLPQNDTPTLSCLQTKIRQGSNVVELGSGVGVVGTSLAAMGAIVLLTDLPTLVGHSVLPNLLRNQQNSRLEEASTSTSPLPDWLYKIASTFDPDLLEEVDEVCDHPTLCFPIGDCGGWASAAAVDWTVPLCQQVPDMPSSIDYVVASDCVWLVSMLNSLLDTVAAIFALAMDRSSDSDDDSSQPHLLLSFQRRDKDNQDDAKFTRVDTVLENVKQRGWHVECLAWRYVSVEGETEPKELFLFDISNPPNK
eukprot:Nitzschia sp. Nitz4//scaffold32_size149145//94155//95291//NITZ4_002889-RA/size149145-processed-gene-0.130-mRNA-1//-1//CDS//3329548099//7279//frame0